MPRTEKRTLYLLPLKQVYTILARISERPSKANHSMQLERSAVKVARSVLRGKRKKCPDLPEPTGLCKGEYPMYTGLTLDQCSAIMSGDPSVIT